MKTDGFGRNVKIPEIDLFIYLFITLFTVWYKVILNNYNRDDHS